MARVARGGPALGCMYADATGAGRCAEAQEDADCLCEERLEAAKNSPMSPCGLVWDGEISGRDCGAVSGGPR